MPIDVVLNVYDLIEQVPICAGFFHTGIEIFGVEYSYGQGGGVFECEPGTAPNARFREAIVLGTIKTSAESQAALDRIRPDFPGDQYSLIFKNCNDFSSAYARALLGRDIPGWVNRLARMGRIWPVPYFLPAKLTGGRSTGPSSTAQPLLGPSSQPLFQGSGQSLNGNSNTIGGMKNTISGFILGIRSLFRKPPSCDAIDVRLIQNEAEARELRAAAAAARLSGPSAV